MSDKEQSVKKSETPNTKQKRKNKGERAKPALLLFGKDVSAEDIVAAIKAESKRQLEAGDSGRRMPRIGKKV